LGVASAHSLSVFGPLGGGQRGLAVLFDVRRWLLTESGCDTNPRNMFALVVPFEIWLIANRPVAAPIGAGPELPLPALRILMAEDSPDNITIALA
jgi:hypothetical protein